MVNINELIKGVYRLKKSKSYNKYIHEEFRISKDTYQNIFSIIIKPECLNGRIEEIIPFIFNHLSNHSIKVHSISAFKGSYIRENYIIEQQYNTLNKYSKMKEIKSFSKHIIGSYEFLRKYKSNFNSYKLEKLAHKLGSKKVSNGIYSLNIKHDDIEYEVLNAFHPYQKQHFCLPNNISIFMECSSNQNMPYLADKVIGNFDPHNAHKQSLRHSLLKKSDYFNVKINTIYNGVHISPSPFEAVKSIILFSEKHNGEKPKLTDFIIIQHLLKRGFTLSCIKRMFENPVITLNNNNMYLFEMLEGLNTDEIIEKLCEMEWINEYINY
ncbi:hypothetical protein GZH82_00230 [Staphylococcus ursi]|uniref:hypothetical protein n=1 Tax=Staphylococcus sp. MI 10-1553 TaxID=1912064 RepID=UPI001397E664|nr:hypothetical protein [Staphylococcus sp. MI 10-1553]QHW35919.1 hypothetical protein GZH82_00230 [Staphylococcus sp. MI 10-1553]